MNSNKRSENTADLFQGLFKITIIITAVLALSIIVLSYYIDALNDSNDAYVLNCKELIQKNASLQSEIHKLQKDIDLSEDLAELKDKKIAELENELQNYQDQMQCEIDNTYGEDWGSMKTYMSYKAITDESSIQYGLQKRATTDPGTGIRTIDGDYCVAIGSGWGYSVGDRILVILRDGKTFNAIVADAKADIHTNADNKTSMYDGSVIEFVVDIPALPDYARISGNIGTIEQFSGGVISIIKR